MSGGNADGRMGFRFPLAAVLRVKQSIEKQEELVLQKVLLEISQVQHQIDDLTLDIVRARQLRDQAMQQMIAAIELDSMSNQIKDAMDRRQELIHSLGELRRKRELQNRRYQTARNNREMLSEMQARQKDAYAQESARAEQRFFDEIFASRARRN